MNKDCFGFTKIIGICLVMMATAGLSLSVEAQESTQVQAEQPGAETVVHLSHFTDDIHAASMALKIAGGLAKQGQVVELFVDLEGVRLADSRQPDSLRWMDSPSIKDLYAAFIEAGGRIVVCPHCAASAGIQEDDLRDGARIAKDGEIVRLLSQAERVIDY